MAKRKRSGAADKAQKNWHAELWELGRMLTARGLWAPASVLRQWNDRKVRSAQSWAAEASIAAVHGTDAPVAPPHVASLESSEVVLARLELRRRLADLAETANRNGGFAP